MRRSIACIIVSLLTGCATLHGSTNDSLATAGYETKELGPGHYEIYMPVSELTDQKVVDEMFNRRASELCNGGSYTALHRDGTSGQANQVYSGHTHKFPAISGQVRCEKPT
jgi:hypothetical protein